MKTCVLTPGTLILTEGINKNVREVFNYLKSCGKNSHESKDYNGSADDNIGLTTMEFIEYESGTIENITGLFISSISMEEFRTLISNPIEQTYQIY